jgi:deoxycytidylate deaminase
MTCGKAVVLATLRCTDGRVYHGENACLDPRTVCPRLPGEGYAKCLHVCRQVTHAEIAALFAAIDAGSEPRGGHMVIKHSHICQDCRDTLRDYRVTWELL